MGERLGQLSPGEPDPAWARVRSFLALLPQRRRQAEQLDGRRVELMGQPPHVVRQALDPLSSRADPFFEGGGIDLWAGLFQFGELPYHRGQALAEIIVKLTRQPPVFLLLAGPAAAFVTGQTWNIDGGYSLT